MGSKGARVDSQLKTRWGQILEEQTIRPSRAPARNRLRRLGPVLAGSVLVTGSSLLSIWVHVQAINLRYQVSQEYEENRRLQERHAALEVERQMLRSPERITRIAEEELGMRVAGVEERTILR